MAVAALIAVGLIGCRPTAPPAASFWQPVNVAGDVLPAESLGAHHCVFDQRTGLMWEVKRADRPLHRPGDTFTWHQPDADKNYGEAGVPGGGQCALEQCDTTSLVAAVNAAGWCGYHDWSLPGREQLMTLGDRRLADTQRVIDPDFFPEDPTGEYWTASSFRLYPTGAWLVDSRNGLDRVENKSAARYARLVRRHALPADHVQEN